METAKAAVPDVIPKQSDMFCECDSFTRSRLPQNSNVLEDTHFLVQNILWGQLVCHAFQVVFSPQRGGDGHIAGFGGPPWVATIPILSGWPWTNSMGAMANSKKASWNTAMAAMANSQKASWTNAMAPVAKSAGQP